MGNTLHGTQLKSKMHKVLYLDHFFLIYTNNLFDDSASNLVLFVDDIFLFSWVEK